MRDARRRQEAASASRQAGLSAYGSLIEKSEVAVDTDSNWMITMSDVMSLLLVFFIMFFVMTRNTVKSEELESDRTAKSPVGEAGALRDDDPIGERIRDELNVGFADLAVDEHVSVRATNRDVIIAMKDKVLFNPGEADVLDATEPVLGTIAGIIRRYPEFHVEIDGHTDNVPITTPLYPSNWELSVARATSVLKYFIDEHHMDPSRFSVRGNADQRPIAPNDTPENRARNRRVEIKLKRPEREYGL